jgi:hypothetical protein
VKISSSFIITLFLLLAVPLCHAQQKKYKSSKNLNMKTDFTTTISVEQTPQQVYDAINNVRGWWSQDIEGTTNKLNSAFDYHFKNLHLCKIRVIEMVPCKKVAWQVEENYFSFTKDKTEWVGTQMIFEISVNADKAKLTFTHKGLVPEYECYNVCHDAWTDFIQKSLYQFITTGQGNPNPKDGIGTINSENISRHDLGK